MAFKDGATYIQGVDWDLFDVAGRTQVQACDEAGTLTDGQAIVLARIGGLRVDNQGFLVEPGPEPNPAWEFIEPDTITRNDKIVARLAGWNSHEDRRAFGRIIATTMNAMHDIPLGLIESLNPGEAKEAIEHWREPTRVCGPAAPEGDI